MLCVGAGLSGLECQVHGRIASESRMTAKMTGKPYEADLNRLKSARMRVGTTMLLAAMTPL